MTRLVGLLVTVFAVLACGAVAFAHVERTSYWPDPAADTRSRPLRRGAPPTVSASGTAPKRRG